jgi:NADH-quinone oxidoreductase subunit N
VNPGSLTVDLTPFLPELILAGGLLLLLLLNLFVKQNRGLVTAAGSVLLLAVVSVVAMAGDQNTGGYLFGALLQNGAAIYFRVFFCLATALSLGMLALSFPRDGEPFLLMMSGILGMFLLAGANDLVTLFVSLELVSIPSYVLAGYKRHDVRSGEAALKYVLFGAMSSGIMIYGFSLLYGLSGTTSLPAMAATLSQNYPSSPLFFVGLLLILSGIGYKIAMVPLHFWCPDVYEGSPTAVTAFFSVAPKAAGFAALLRLLPVFSSLNAFYGINSLTLFSVAAAVTMTVGNLGAIWQTSLKRLLAYSSIAHAGYILMGFAVAVAYPGTELYNETTLAILFYLGVYLFMNLGAFMVVDLVERKRGSDSIEVFKGLGRTASGPAIILAIFLFSLTGIPPFAGFTGKFLLFAALIKGRLFPLAIIGIANTVVSLYYYTRVVRDMFLEEPDEEAVPANPGPGIRIGALSGTLFFLTLVPTIVLGVFWGQLAEWIHLKVF